MKYSEYKEQKEESNAGQGYHKDKEKVNYLKLSDDGAVVKGFLIADIDTLEDFPITGVHELDLFGNFKNKYRCGGEDCPICEYKKMHKLDKDQNSELYRRTKAFVSFYNLADGEMYLWERPAKIIGSFISALESFNDNNETNLNFNEVMFEIRRQGKKGSKETTYSITAYKVKKSDEAKHKKAYEENLIVPLYGTETMNPVINGYDNEWITEKLTEVYPPELSLTKKDNDFDLGDDAFPSAHEDIPF